MAKRNRTRRTETPTEKASVAQSEERVPCEDMVAGSTPVRGSVTNLDGEPAVGPSTESLGPTFLPDGTEESVSSARVEWRGDGGILVAVDNRKDPPDLELPEGSAVVFANTDGDGNISVFAKNVVKQAVVKAKKLAVDVKVCAACGVVASAIAKTCQHCGESSWL